MPADDGTRPQEKQLLGALQSVGLGSEINLRGLNAYPAPDTAAAPVAMLGPHPRVQRDGSR